MNTHPSTRLYFIMCIIIIMYNLTKDLQYTHHRVACPIICVSIFVDKNVCVIIVLGCLFVFGFFWCCAHFVKQGVCISERYTLQSNLCYYSFFSFSSFHDNNFRTFSTLVKHFLTRWNTYSSSSSLLARPPGWPFRTPPEHPPWSWLSTLSNQKHWFFRP